MSLSPFQQLIVPTSTTPHPDPHVIHDNPIFHHILSYCTHVEYILLSCCSHTFQNMIQYDHGIRIVLELNGRLDCNEIVVQLASKPQWQQVVSAITFEFCNRLVDATLKLSSFRHCTLLNLNGCSKITDTGVELAMTSCPHLNTLSLYWCVSLTDVGLYSIAKSRCAPSLATLNLSGVKHGTDAALASITSSCPNLIFLDLTRMVKLTDKSLQAVATGCKSLTTLILYAASGFTDTGIGALSGCIHLTHLDLTGTPHLTDKGLIQLVSGPKHIQKLILQWCLNVTDRGLRAIGDHEHELTSISVHGLPRVTAAGLSSLSFGCPHITWLDINGCRLITDRSFQTMSHVFPRLRELATL